MRKCGYTETAFADDLNCWKAFGIPPSPEGMRGPRPGHGRILADLRSVQHELHMWGRANQVTFNLKLIVSFCQPSFEFRRNFQGIRLRVRHTIAHVCYIRYIMKMRCKLADLPNSSKNFWKLANSFQGNTRSSESV